MEKGRIEGCREGALCVSFSGGWTGFEGRMLDDFLVVILREFWVFAV